MARVGSPVPVRRAVPRGRDAILITPEGDVVRPEWRDRRRAHDVAAREGGVRNWDTGFCWIRDATFTLLALLGAGYEAEAVAWREWLLRAVAGAPEQMQLMYGVEGERRLVEYELDWLPAYAGSRPVRVGNAASEQFQLDVYGELMDALHQARRHGIRRTTRHGTSSERSSTSWSRTGGTRTTASGRCAADAATSCTRRSWHGRGGPRGAGNRAVRPRRAARRLAEVTGDIFDDVCARGFDTRRDTFTQYYGSKSWTPPCCSSRRSGSCRRRTSGSAVPSRRSSASCAAMASSSAYTMTEHTQQLDELPPGERAFRLPDDLSGHGRRLRARRASGRGRGVFEAAGASAQ